MKAKNITNILHDAYNEMDILRFATDSADAFVRLWEPDTDQLYFMVTLTIP